MIGVQFLTNKTDQRLDKLGISLQTGNSPVANYVPFLLTGNLLFISGQIPIIDGKTFPHRNSRREH